MGIAAPSWSRRKHLQLLFTCWGLPAPPPSFPLVFPPPPRFAGILGWKLPSLLQVEGAGALFLLLLVISQILQRSFSREKWEAKADKQENMPRGWLLASPLPKN